MLIIVFWILCALAGAALLSPHNKAGIGCAAGGCLGPIGILLAWIERSNLDRLADQHREEIRAAELRTIAAASRPSSPRCLPTNAKSGIAPIVPNASW